MQFIITGASSGIGLALAKQCRSLGHRVIHLARRPCPLPEVQSLAVDLSDAEDLAQQISVLLPMLTDDPICLVHAAAAHDNDTIQNMNLAQFRRALEIQLLAPAALNHALIPHMKNGSSIIYVGSTLSEKAVKNVASYAICKHALVGMMRATCQDLDNTGIHTAIICPGFTDTEMLHEHLNHSAEIINAVTQFVSARRLIHPEEIADTLYFAATHPVLNGAVIHANLGQIDR